MWQAWWIGADGTPPVHRFDQQGKLRGRQDYPAIDQRWPDEPMPFEPLGEQAQPGAIPLKRLQVGAALAAEQKYMPAIGLHGEQRPHQRGEPVESQAHADRLAREIDLRAWGQKDHDTSRNARSTRASAFSLT